MGIEMKNINEEYEQFEDSILYLSGQEERNARLLFSKKLEELITQNPNVPDLYHKLGLCLYGLGTGVFQGMIPPNTFGHLTKRVKSQREVKNVYKEKTQSLYSRV